MAFVYCMYILLVSIATLTALPAPLPECGGKRADIVFLIDTSTSIGRTNFYDYVRPFVSGVADTFDIGPSASQTRVGVVTFSDYHHLQFHLGEFLNKEELKNKILSIPIYGGNTNTGEALTYVADEMFKEEHGSRSNSTHIIIILTDGASQRFEATREAAFATHEKGLLVFAIGVGDQVDNRELNYLASDPDSEYKFNVTSFEALDEIKRRLSMKTCEVTTLRPISVSSTTPLSTSISTPSTSTRTTSATTTTTTEEVSTAGVSVTTEYGGFQGDEDIRTRACGGKPAEVFFILDSSGSIERKDFNITTLDFVRNVTSLFDIGTGKNQTRVGIVTFSDDVSEIFPLDAYTTRNDLWNAISPENIPHKAKGTNTAEALRSVQEKGFSPDNARQDVAHVAIVITDGQSQNVEATVKAAKAVHASGIYVFAIGVGGSADELELKDIASDPDDKFVFTVKDYAALSGIRDLLAIRTCTVEQPFEVDVKDQSACELDNAELVFVYDSFSMGLKSTRQISTETSQIAATLSRRVENLSAGTISQSCHSNLDITMRNAATFARQSLILQDTISSKMASLMKDVRRKWFSRNGKSGRQVMVLYVDETSLENFEDLKSQSMYAQHKEIEVFVVAIGEVNTKALDIKALASKPSDSHVISVSSARHLPKFRNMLVQNICEDARAKKTTETRQQTTTEKNEASPTPFLPPVDVH